MRHATEIYLRRRGELPRWALASRKKGQLLFIGAHFPAPPQPPVDADQLPPVMQITQSALAAARVLHLEPVPPAWQDNFMTISDAALPAAALLATLRSGNSSSPRLTWYGPDSERVELSGRVLDNWVAKTSNLLQDELDAEPGMRLLLDMPSHWKSLVWSLAGWQLGMEIVLDDGGEQQRADIAVTADPASAHAAQAVVAVALPALAMTWPGGLPGGLLDYASEVRSHGDVFMPHMDGRPDFAALSSRGATYPHSALLTDFAVLQPSGVRLLVQAGDGLEETLAKALGAWAADGSVVLVHPDVEVTEHLMATERVTGAAAG